MTNDERIEAMARAINAEFYGQAWDKTTVFRKGACFDTALAALAAARLEEMVREAADEGFEAGFLCVHYETQEAADTVNAIVREVMGK